MFISSRVSNWLTVFAIIAVMVVSFCRTSHAAINWDSQALGTVNMIPDQPLGAGTQWWFDPVNWSATEPGEGVPWYLPPTVDGTNTTDIQVNEGTTTLPGGEGVVYDPVNDPHYADLDGPGGLTLGAEDLDYPDGYGPTNLWRMYITRNATSGQQNTVTIKGDISFLHSGTQAVIVGRSGSSLENQNLGRLVQKAGHMLILGDMDIAGSEASGWGNGTYEYHSGSLEVGPEHVTEIRLSPGSGSGAGGVAKFVVHNPTTGGYIRTRDFHIVPGHGQGTSFVANGTTLGVGIMEFHYENGGTRPIQVRENLQINNGSTAGNASTRAALLDLVLHEAPCTGAGCVPNNLGLFDVDFGDLGFGTITTGSLAVSYGATFSNIANKDQVYSEGSTVSAMFGGTRYDWTISYSGHIDWVDGQEDNSVINEILGQGNGTDVVLIGLGSEEVGLPGDYNNDGRVDAGDYVRWRNHLGEANEANINNNGDGGDVGISDYAYWKARYGNPGSGGGGLVGGTSIPEPSAIGLTLIALIGLLGIRRRVC